MGIRVPLSVLGGCAAALVAASSPAGAATPAGASAVPAARVPVLVPGGQEVGYVTVDASAIRITPDGSVTAGGVYRCSAETARGRVVLVDARVQQDGVTAGLPGVRARCDGAVHGWRVTAQPGVRFGPGPATVSASLDRLDAEQVAFLVVPLPTTLAENAQPVLLAG